MTAVCDDTPGSKDLDKLEEAVDAPDEPQKPVRATCCCCLVCFLCIGPVCCCWVLLLLLPAVHVDELESNDSSGVLMTVRSVLFMGAYQHLTSAWAFASC